MPEFPKEYNLIADSRSTEVIYDNVFMCLAGSHLVVSSFETNKTINV